MISSSQQARVRPRYRLGGGASGLPSLVEWELLGVPAPAGGAADGEVVEAAHRVYEMLIALWAPGVIEAASDLGMFNVLSVRELTSMQVADELGLDIKPTRVLLDALFAYRILDRISAPEPGDGFVYILPDAMGACLVEGGMFSLAGKIKYDRLMAWESWRRLADTVRGARTGHGHESVNGIPESVYESLAFGINFWAPPIVEILITALKSTGWGDHDARRMLDVGCGTGLYSHLMLHRLPGLTSLGLDGEIMVPLARSQAQSIGVGDRFDALSCDFWSHDWGRGLDLTLFVNIFHLQTPQSARRLLDQAARSLAPGGLVAIVDQIIDDERGEDGPHDRFFRLFAASMLATGGGDAYSIATYADWLVETGFVIESLEDAPMHRVLLARRADETPPLSAPALRTGKA